MYPDLRLAPPLKSQPVRFEGLAGDDHPIVHLDMEMITNRYAGWVVDVQDETSVGSGGVDGRVQDETGVVDAEERRAAVDHATLQVHLDQRRRRHFVVQQAERVQQKVLLLARHSSLSIEFFLCSILGHGGPRPPPPAPPPY